MDVLRFVAEIIKVIVWPVATIFLALKFQKPVSELITRITRISAGDKSIEFEKVLQKAAKELPSPRLQIHTVPEKDNFQKLAEIDPRAAILTAWRDVESALIRVGEKNQIAVGEPSSIAASLYMQGKIDFNTQQVFAELRKLRNQAVHDTSYEPTTEQALEFRALTERLAAKFDSI